MIVIQTKSVNKSLLDDIVSLGEHPECAIVSSLDGNELYQVLIPIISIIAPLAAETVQKLFADDRVTIKFDGVEISTQGYKKAMKLLDAVLQKRKEEKLGQDGENIDDD